MSAGELSNKTLVRKSPPLPRMPGRRPQWHARTRDWWTRVWDSPMAERYLTADIDALYVAAALHDSYWRAVDQGEKTTTLAAELRRQLEQFGLSVMSRRRLDWRIREPLEEPEQPRKKVAGERTRDTPDPRDAFRVVEGGKP